MKKPLHKTTVLTLDTIRSWHPCYDPVRWFAPDWTGGILDILADERIPPADRVWAVLQSKLLTPIHLEKFSDFCVSRAMAWALYAANYAAANYAAANYAAANYAAANYAAANYADAAAAYANAAYANANANYADDAYEERYAQVDFLIDLLW